MTYKQIEASRETRLWIGQAIVPAVALIMAVSPEARQAVSQKAVRIKQTIKDKFKKEKGL